MDLAKLFQSRRDAVAARSQHFSLSNCQSFIVVKRSRGGQVDYIEIKPRPLITPVNLPLMQQYQGVESTQIELDDRQVVISKRYKLEDLVGQGISYLIGAEMIGGKPIGGIEYDKVINTDVDDRDVDYKMILRRRLK